MNKLRVVAKDADDDFDISRCFAKKNETKRAEIESAVDLRRPKTRWRHNNLENKRWTLTEGQEEKNLSVAKEAEIKGDSVMLSANNIKPKTFSHEPEEKRVGITSGADLRRPKARHRANDESEGGIPPRESQGSWSSWSDTASLFAGTRPQSLRRRLTTAEKISRLQQVNTDGLDGTCAIFEVRFSILFLGGSQRDLMANWLEHIRKSLATVLRSDLGLRILPIRDEAYKEVQRWIRSEADLHRRLAIFDDLPQFLDLDFGNGRFFMKSTKEGPRTFRSRIRVGYDLGLEREAVRSSLHSNWAYQATSGGYFDSPLQYGNMVRIGALYLYPEGRLNVTSMEKELLRHFKFKYYIGLGVDWVN